MPKGAYTHIPWNKGKRYCPVNHDTLLVGRTSAGGCKVCTRDIKSRYQWSVAGQIRRWANHLKNQYGINLREWAALIVASNGRCEACGVVFVSDTQCHIDHSHQTGKVRGLLCQGCNIKIGAIESPEYKKILKYLNKGN
jgi:hypothetical protein